MKIEFDSDVPVGEFGLKVTDSIAELAERTGIPKDKIEEFVKQNNNNQNKNG